MKPRYARARGEHVFEVEDHAAACAFVCEEAVAKGDRKIRPRAVIAPVIEERLTIAFCAGVRQGRAELRAELGEIVSELVKKAIAGIALEPANCPHCHGGRSDGGNCVGCNGTGRFRPGA